MPTIAERFDAIYSGPAHSPVRTRIQREAYGDEYPADVEPFSLVTWSDLRRIARDLGVGPGQELADLACGEGGPGLWVARETGARLTGVDISSVAIARARRRAAFVGMEDRTQFVMGDLADTGLPSASFDGAMSVDSLWIAPDKRAALREIGRILRPGGRLVFTTWDFGAVAGAEHQIADHRPLLSEAGFQVEAYDGTTNWEQHFRALAAGYEAARDELADEMGEAAASEEIAYNQRRAALLPNWQRIFVVAHHV